MRIVTYHNKSAFLIRVIRVPTFFCKTYAFEYALPLEVKAMRFAVLVFLVLFATVLAQAQPGRELSTDQRVLTGIEWRLVSLGPTGAEQDVIPGTTVTLRLGEDGRASGSTGCNSYGGSYQVRGDTISFSRIAATRRACLDQNANQQEHRFLSALEISEQVPALVESSHDPLRPHPQRAELRQQFSSRSARPDVDHRVTTASDPIEMLVSYYEAINARDYRRAYRLWESPESSYERFVAGFADTDRVRLLVEPSGRNEGAAGSVYAEIHDHSRRHYSRRERACFCRLLRAAQIECARQRLADLPGRYFHDAGGRKGLANAFTGLSQFSISYF